MKNLSTDIKTMFFISFILIITCSPLLNAQTYFSSTPNTVGYSLNVSVPPIFTIDDVRPYMRNIMNAPMPVGFKLPSEFTGKSVDEAVAILNKKYPEFENKEGQRLIDAVLQSPVRYQEMMMYAMGIRDYYVPGWRNNITRQ